MTTCTCGEQNTDPHWHYDFTGNCERGEHHNCSRILRGATGYHWWCACSCHPNEPKANFREGRKAVDTWRKAREG